MKPFESEQRQRARSINKQAAEETPNQFLDWWQTYGRERWMAGEPIVFPDRGLALAVGPHMYLVNGVPVRKPHLTAADLVLLREMKVRL